MKKKKKIKDSKIKKILYELLESGFFDREGKTALDVAQKLFQKGFTIKGKKIGMIGRMLTQMCQDSTTGLERYEIPKEKRVRGEKLIFKRVTKH